VFAEANKGKAQALAAFESVITDGSDLASSRSPCSNGKIVEQWQCHM
jgi:hypothetical protein